MKRLIHFYNCDLLLLYKMIVNSDQEEAIEKCCDVTKNIVSVTGSAGTGKTSVIQLIASRLIKHGYNVLIAAPTGVAAKRVSSVTGYAAKTLHRLLEFSLPHEIDEKTGKPCGKTFPKRDKYSPLDADIILVDEYSMVNWETHRYLINAIKAPTKLRVFGDINQLSPIEDGNNTRNESPLAYLLRLFTKVVLTKIVRQADRSSIVTNGSDILRGYMPKVYSDFKIISTTNTNDKLLELVNIYANQGIDYGLVNNQIITPIRKTWSGTTKLNLLIQHQLGKQQGKRIKLPRNSWEDDTELVIYEEDKIVWTKNNYRLGIFNGEIGTVSNINEETNSFSIDFGDRCIDIPETIVEPFYDSTTGNIIYTTSSPRKYIDLAYVLTTHRTQGSEFQNVIYVINKSSYILQNRHNLYTGITRARKFVTIITDKNSLMNSVKKEN